MFSLIKGKILQYLTPILVTVFLGLVTALSVTWYFYQSATERVGVLETKLSQKDEEVKRLNTALREERIAAANLKDYTATVEANTENLKNEIANLKTNANIPALDPNDLAVFLCGRGLAERTACDDPNP